jgi:hypothetical protein
MPVRRDTRLADALRVHAGHAVKGEGMNRTNPPTASPAVKAQSFKQKFKLPGMIVAVAMMWLDYVLIYHGLTADVSSALNGGMVIMLAAAVVAYYFG